MTYYKVAVTTMRKEILFDTVDVLIFLLPLRNYILHLYFLSIITPMAQFTKDGSAGARN